jgi:hypothetical protein
MLEHARDVARRVEHPDDFDHLIPHPVEDEKPPKTWDRPNANAP